MCLGFGGSFKTLEQRPGDREDRWQPTCADGLVCSTWPHSRRVPLELLQALLHRLQVIVCWFSRHCHCLPFSIQVSAGRL